MRFNLKPGDTIPDIKGDVELDCMGQGPKTALFGYIGVKFTHVSGNFKIYGGSLTSLEGCSQEVGGNFSLNAVDGVVSLKGSPSKVGALSLTTCRDLTSLEGCPEKITTSVHIMDCRRLKKFTGLPRNIYSNLRISHLNPGLSESLEGLPDYVSGDFIFKNISFPETKTPGEWLRYFPKKIGGNLNLSFIFQSKTQVVFRVSDITDADIEVGGRIYV